MSLQKTDNTSNTSAHPQLREGSVLNPEMRDYVDSPSHYTGGEIECIDAIEAMLSAEGFEGYLRGQILKYTWRFRQKKTLHGMEVAEGQQDLEKAQWYQHRLMDFNIKRHAQHFQQMESERLAMHLKIHEEDDE